MIVGVALDSPGSRSRYEAVPADADNQLIVSIGWGSPGLEHMPHDQFKAQYKLARQAKMFCGICGKSL